MSLFRRLAVWFSRNPSRYEHEFEPFCISSDLIDQHGRILGSVTRRGRICVHCGNTDIFKAWPCKREAA